MFKGVPKNISIFFPKYLMGLGLEPQSHHLKNFTTYWEKRIKKRINTIKNDGRNIRKP